ISDSKIQREARRGPPVILSIEVRPQGSSVRFASSNPDLSARWITQQKIRKGVPIRQTGRRRCIPRSEAQTTPRVGRAERIEPQPVNVGPELKTVSARSLRDAVEEIEAVVFPQRQGSRIAHRLVGVRNVCRS